MIKNDRRTNLLDETVVLHEIMISNCEIWIINGIIIGREIILSTFHPSVMSRDEIRDRERNKRDQRNEYFFFFSNMKGNKYVQLYQI